MPTAEDIHKALEKALKEAPESAIASAGVIAVSWPIAVSTSEPGSICFYNTFRGNACSASTLLDIGGSHVTGENGMVTFHLNDFQCVSPINLGNSGTIYEYPVNVVATPTTDRPAMLSVQSKIGIDNNQNSDVLITVFSWGPNGKALGSVEFNWRCIVPTVAGPPP